MTCSLRVFPPLSDLDIARGHLFPDHLRSGESTRDDDFDNRWSWDDCSNKEDKVDSSDSDYDSREWLSQCVISPSPDGGLLVIGYFNRIVVYTLRNQSSWQLSSCKTFDSFSPFEKISCLCLIPLSSQLKSNEGGIDWTAILVGSNHGILRVCTDAGIPLFLQRFCDDSMTSIKCSSFYSPSLVGLHVLPPESDQTDEVLLTFSSNVVVTIEGFALFDTLRFARNHLVKNPTESPSLLDLKISVPCSKWLLGNSSTGKIRDTATSGEITTSIFDDLVNVSFRGPHARVQQKDLKDLTARNLFTTGETPFVGFYRTKRIEVPSILTNVAQAVVSKAKNFLPLFSSKSEEDKSEAPPVHLKEKLGLYDQHREGKRIVFSPDKQLAVISDDFGRVCLFDPNSKLIVRMWKGYREAQCAFVSITEDESIPSSRKSLCLVIYAPKRGLLELWRLQLGPRIAAFNVSKKGQLFSFNHSIFGLTRKVVEKNGMPPQKVFLLYLSNGQMFTVDIPFACTLTDESNLHVKDGHLLKELTKALETQDYSRQLIIIKQLQATSSKIDALTLALSSLEDATVLSRSFIDLFNEFVGHRNFDEALDVDEKLFYQCCQRVLQLAKLYQWLSSHKSLKIPSHQLHRNHPCDIEAVSQSMGWRESDVAKCLSLFSLRHSVIPPNSSLSSRTLITFCDFVKCFSIQTTQIVKDSGHENSNGSSRDTFLQEKIPIDIKRAPHKDSTCDLESLSKFICELIFDEAVDIDQLYNAFKESCLTPKSLLPLLFTCWLSSPSLCDNWDNWGKLTSASRDFGSRIVEDVPADQSLSQSWKIVCGSTISCSNIPSALVGMFVIKTVTEEMLTEKTKKEPNEEPSEVSADDEWETLHVDRERLNIVLKQMEDVFLLNLLLSCDKKYHHENLSLIQLINSEPGIVSEMVSKWAITLSLDVLSLFKFFKQEDEADEAIEENAHEAKQVSVGTDAFMEKSKSEENIEELLLHVIRCFPHSLRREVILINCCWETVKQWMTIPSVTEGHLLKNSLNLLNSLGQSHLKHNLACLLWKTFILMQLENLASLSEKMAKIPKDRICRKELSMGEDCIEAFLSFANDLLEMIIENIRPLESEPLPDFKIDDWWRHQDGNERRPPLAVLVLSVKPANPAIVLSHIHITQVLSSMATFQMKGIRPLSLFSSNTRQVLFGDLACRTFDPPPSDYALNENRRQFLEHVVASIAHSLPSATTSEDNLLLTPSRVSSEANKLFRIALTLTREWEMDTDPIRKIFVCNLYANCCDSLAEEIRSSCRDRTRLVMDLIPIVCQRVLLDTAHISLLSLPPPVFQWMKEMKCDFTVCNAPLSSTSQLLEFIRVNLPEDSSHLKNISILADHLASRS